MDVLKRGVRLCEGPVGAVVKVKVTSRKLMICLLASTVIRSPFWLKTRHIFFLMFSVSLGAALEMARPSSL